MLYIDLVTTHDVIPKIGLLRILLTVISWIIEYKHPSYVK